MFRVADFAQYQLNMANIMRTQSNVAETHIQISSGKKSQDYASIATNSFELVSIERSLDRTVQFNKNIDRAQMRLEVMESSIATMTDRATEVLSIISQGLSGDNMDDLPLQQFAASFSTEIEALLNTQIEGRYLFAGSQTNTIPVDLSDPAYTPQAGLPGTFTADTGYYQGDTAILSIRADDNFELDYGITADESAFEELLRALSYMSYAGANSDITVLEESFSLMKSALDGLSDLRGQIGANSKILLKTKEAHEDFLTFAENTASEIEDVDIAQATTEMSFAEVQLQGSYLALSRVSNLNLLQYL